MKLSIRYLKWIFLALCVPVVLTLLTLALLDVLTEGQWVFIGGILPLIAAERAFILGAGTNELYKPIRRRRLLLPIIIAALMMTILVGADSSPASIVESASLLASA